MVNKRLRISSLPGSTRLRAEALAVVIKLPCGYWDSRLRGNDTRLQDEEDGGGGASIKALIWS
jgi:hypothetical protein